MHGRTHLVGDLSFFLIYFDHSTEYKWNSISVWISAMEISSVFCENMFGRNKSLNQYTVGTILVLCGCVLTICVLWCLTYIQVGGLMINTTKETKL